MARVKIEPGGVAVFAVVILGALLLLFFELKPAATKKPAGESAPPNSVTESAQPPQPREEKKRIAPAAAEEEMAPQRQLAMQQAGGNSPVRIFFGFNHAGINKNVYCIFDRIENLVRQKGSGGVRIVVEGNTDSIGPSGYNLELSKRRAARVADSLSKRLGIPVNRIKLVANGSTKPISSNATRDGRANNRRTDIIIYH